MDLRPWGFRRGLTRVAVVAGLAVLLLLVGMGFWAGYLQLTGNFHVVEPGIAYRSNTLGQEQLSEVLKQNGIRTIVNLRGTGIGQSWYDTESNVARGQGVLLVDIPMDDDRLPAPAVMAKLIEVLRTAPRPLLIHCKAGADRTGLASALFELVVMHQSAPKAAEQLSFAFGHFPWLGSRTVAMDQAFWQVVDDPASAIGTTLSADPRS